ncbi:MAG: hypothetical protein JNK72_20865 [Myxococcales bacterium]|nr:hypothetical protein [Myxococcales bacterium]
MVVMGCGDGAQSFPTEDDVPGGGEDAAVEDVGPGPSFDIPRDMGNGEFDSGGGFDAGNRVDTGSPVDRGNVTPVDTGGGGGVCPSSCRSNADCNPCRDPSDPPGSEYCCTSGLCLFMSGMCSASTGDGGTNPGGDDGGGGADGGGAGADASGGADASLDFDAAGGLDAGP